jgi:hypothetical protein
VANSGNPILVHSNRSADWCYQLFNPSIVVVGSTWHLLIEGKALGDENFRMGYSQSTLGAGPNFNPSLSASPVLAGYCGNADLHYVPSRNALIALHCSQTTGAVATIRASYASLGSDLGQPSSWQLAPGFNLEKPGVFLTDPSLLFTSNSSRPWTAMLAYNYDQTSGYRAFGNVTLEQFYDFVH